MRKERRQERRRRGRRKGQMEKKGSEKVKRGKIGFWRVTILMEWFIF